MPTCVRTFPAVVLPRMGNQPLKDAALLLPRTTLQKDAPSTSRSLAEIVASVRRLPRHHVIGISLPKKELLDSLRLLMAELDDIGEFIYLDSSSRSCIIKIRHR